MASCSAILSTPQRRLLKALLANESQITEQCNVRISRFTEMLNVLQCINHHDDSDEHALKCDEFIRAHASLDCDIPVCEMVPGATQIAISCNCLCIQAACFRILYKWIPRLDTLRMKLLKIKKMCSDSAHVPGNGVNTCAQIERIVHQLLKSTP